MRAIQWLCFITLFAVMFCFAVLTANGQTLRGDALGLRPNSLPSTCNIGDLRVDSADAYRLKLCNALNTWSIASFADPMTTNGDLITQAAGVPARLGIGSTSHVLQVVGGTPAWGFITDANVDAAAGIVDTKLATISASGKVANSATTAASANNASAIVARDPSGNFTAGTITAALTGNVTGNVSGSSGSTTGNAATATALAANPTDCASDTYANAIAASGNLTCATVTNAGLAGSIAASKLVGTDIATLGTVTIGTWSATGIGPTKGGTGLTSYTAGDSIYATASDTLGKVSIGTSLQTWRVTGTGTQGWTTDSIVSAGVERVERATVTCSGSSSITRQSGTWITAIGNISSGNCAITIAAGIFSAAPTCTIGLHATDATNIYSLEAPVTSSTAMAVGAHYLASGSSTVQTPSSLPLHIICMGPR